MVTQLLNLMVTQLSTLMVTQLLTLMVTQLLTLMVTQLLTLMVTHTPTCLDVIYGKKDLVYVYILGFKYRVVCILSCYTELLY